MASFLKQVREFLKYVVGLKFEAEPDNNKLRGLFMSEVKKCGGKMDLSEGVKVSKVQIKKGVKRAAAVSADD